MSQRPISAVTGRFRALRGHLWFMRHFGVCRWARYERARRSGMTIDYSAILSADECAVLAEHAKRVPWAERSITGGYENP